MSARSGRFSCRDGRRGALAPVEGPDCAALYNPRKRDRPQMPLAVMLRIYFLQQWYGLSDPGAEEALYDMHSMRDFAGLDLAQDTIPDETTILNFRHLLEKHSLTNTKRREC